MIIDSSAIIAILQHEPEQIALAKIISHCRDCKISAATLLECHIVLSNRFKEAGEAQLDAFIYGMDVTVIPISLEQATIARRAFSYFGKGRHAAALNFGDCFSYALAKEAAEPLLFKGTDFGLTDINVVEYQGESSLASSSGSALNKSSTNP